MRWQIIVIGLLLLEISIFIRPYIESSNAFTEVKEKPLEEALPGLTEVLRWRAPFSPAAKSAEDTLSSCAFNPSCPLQLKAIRAYTQGISASRSWFTINSDRELLEKLQGEERKIIGEPKVVEHNPPEFNVWYQLLAQVALWGWLIAAVLAIWRGFTKEGAVVFRPLIRYLSIWVLSFTAWLFFLSQA